MQSILSMNKIQNPKYTQKFEAAWIAAAPTGPRTDGSGEVRTHQSSSLL